MAQEKTVKYFKSAIKRQLKDTGSKSCFIWLIVENSKPSIFVQIDEGIYDTDVVAVPTFMGLLNVFDQIEIQGLQMTFKFDLNDELQTVLKNIAEAKNCDYEKMKVCIYETESKLVAKTYEGDNEISCDYFRQLLALEPKENETETT